MIIRKGQMEALSIYMMKSFVDRMVKHVKQTYRVKFEKQGEEAIRERIRSGIERADYYGIIVEREVAKFIDLTFMIHPGFDTHPEAPWIGEILDDDSLYGGEKIAKIHKQLPDRLRELARSSKPKV